MSVLAPGLLYVAVTDLVYAVDGVFSVAPSLVAVAVRASADFSKVAASLVFDGTGAVVARPEPRLGLLQGPRPGPP